MPATVTVAHDRRASPGGGTAVAGMARSYSLSHVSINPAGLT